MMSETAVYSPNWEASAQSGSPVIVLLHGYGSNERDLPGLASWLPAGVPWVSPRAPLPMQGAGAMWFPLGLPGDPDPDEVTVATGQLWDWLDTHVSHAAPLIPVGFSQGGAMAIELLRTRPERVAATVLLAGLVAPTVHTADAVLAQSRPPVFWGRGSDDGVIPPAAVARTAEYLTAHTDATTHVYPRLGHSVDERIMTDARDFLADVVSRPPKVT